MPSCARANAKQAPNLHALEVEDREVEECLTDLTTVLLGFGVLTTNASSRHRSAGGIGEHDCYGVGWQSSTPYGVVNTRCVDEDCLSNGWKTVGPKGTYVATCTKGDCQLGWVVKKGGERWSVTRTDGGENNFGPFLVTGPKGKFECYYSNILKGGIECEETH